MKATLTAFCVIVLFNSFAQKENIESDYVIKFILNDSSELFGYDYAKEIPTWDEMRSTIDYSRNFGEVGNSFYYFNKKGEVQRVDFVSIDTVIVTDESFCFIQMEMENYGKFWNKVVENDKYILYDKKAFFMIYDKSTNQFVQQNYTGHSQPGKYGLNKDIKMFEKNIKPYFSNCQELVDKVQKNLVIENYADKKPMQTTGYRLFNGIANVKCTD